MKVRAVRIPLVDALVTFDARLVRLVNISRTGALVYAELPWEVGAKGSLTVTYGHTTVKIDGRVVRVGISAPFDPLAEPGWQAAVVFTAPPPEEITALLRRLVAPRPRETQPLRV
jgi:hypothetical protein